MIKRALFILILIAALSTQAYAQANDSREEL